MSQDYLNTKQQEPTLLGIKQALEETFHGCEAKPSLRLWNEWRAKGYYPYIKIGKRVWIDPQAARKALDRRFTIEAI